MNDDLLSRLQAALGPGYRVTEELGRGGMSRVFLADEVSLERKVVIKVLPPELAADLSTDRFRREMALMAQLTHPHIVPILRTSEGDGNGLLFYVMPYEAGDTLRTLMGRERQLPMDQARQVAREVAQALDFAHRRGVVHRDIKPENVLLVDGHAMVIDFGVARALSTASSDRVTATGLTVGTPNYMSPEQASGERELDGRSDIYSLGCLLFEMLAGEVPHRAPTVQMTLSRRLSEPAPDITKLRLTVPGDLQAVLQRALATAPADRFRTAGEMAVALGAMTSDPTRQAATPLPAPRPAARPVVVGVSALVMAAAAWFAWNHGPIRDTTPTVPTANGAPIPIAVLPLENRGQPEDEWFGDGLADELRGALSRHPTLLVKGSRSSNQYRGTSKPLRDVARELGVRYLVTGSVIWEPSSAGRGRVRVSPELIDTNDESTKWRDSFDTLLTDLFAGQRTVGVRMGDALAGSLTSVRPRSSASIARPVKPEAYALFLAGKRELERWTTDAFPRAIELFRRAARTDSSFPDAWAWLAIAISQDGGTGPGDARTPEMFQAAERAMSLAPSDADALAARGIARTQRREYAGSRQDLRRAIDLEPTNSWALWFSSTLESAFGDYEASIRLGRQASQVDPLISGDIHSLVLMRAGRFDEALRVIEAGLSIDSLSTANAWYLQKAQLAALRGDTMALAAGTARTKALGRPPGQPEMWRAIALIRAGRVEEVRRSLTNLAADADRGLPGAGAVAAIYAQMGQADSAVAWLERAVARPGDVLSILQSPALIPIRSDARYIGLLKRVGLR